MRDRSGKMISMNRLTPKQRKAVIACLVEGSSIRATCRMTGVAAHVSHKEHHVTDVTPWVELATALLAFLANGEEQVTPDGGLLTGGLRFPRRISD